jgi:hypothetical protein
MSLSLENRYSISLSLSLSPFSFIRRKVIILLKHASFVNLFILIIEWIEYSFYFGLNSLEVHVVRL